MDYRHFAKRSKGRNVALGTIQPATVIKNTAFQHRWHCNSQVVSVKSCYALEPNPLCSDGHGLGRCVLSIQFAPHAKKPVEFKLQLRLILARRMDEHTTRMEINIGTHGM